MKAICFDIEATDHEEILELSVFDFKSGDEIFHSYFKPRRDRRWPNSQMVHHITPLMVADKPFFSRLAPQIQDLIDSADLLIGFAIDNDINYLKLAGIDIPDDKPIAEAKHWYWICRGKKEGVSLDAVPKLTACANNMGVEFPDEEAHSASTDTRNTLIMFKALLKEYCRLRNLASSENVETLNVERLLTEENISSLNREYADELYLFNKENAKGYITLLPKENGYYIKNSRRDPEKGISIKVESRYTAEADLRRKFAKRADKKFAGLFCLKPVDIEYFKSYTNTFDAEQERMYRKLYTQTKNSKTALSFHLR